MFEHFGCDDAGFLKDIQRPHSWGGHLELGLFLASDNTLAAVVRSCRVRPDSVAEDVFEELRCFVPAPAFVACAVLVGDKADHYDLGVVGCASSGYRALFTIEEWPLCRDLILQFLKTGPLVTSRWTTPTTHGSGNHFQQQESKLNP